MKNYALFASLTLLCGVAGAQSVNISVRANGLPDLSGESAIPVNTAFAVVVDTAGDGFVPILDATLFEGGISTSVDSFLDAPDGDDLVVFSGQITSNFLKGGLVADAGLQGLLIGGSDGISTGDGVGLFWFPGLLESAPTLTGGEFYGEFLGYPGGPLNGSADWEVPAAGATVSLNYITGLSGGEGPDSSVTKQVNPIPEPSALAAFSGLLALLVVRRRA